jgi:hypothetical protein
MTVNTIRAAPPSRALWLPATVLFFLVLIGARPCQADVMVPDTPAGHALSAWLAVFNAGDPTAIQSYYKMYLPAAAGGPGIPDFRAQTGGFELLRIDESEPLRVVFTVKERSSPTTAIGRITMEDASSGKVTNFLLLATRLGGQVIGFDIDGADRARVVDGIAAQLNEYYVFPAVAEQMGQRIRSQLRNGAYDRFRDGGLFAAALAEDLRAISHDRHLQVGFSPIQLPDQGQIPDARAVELFQAQMLRINCGFERVEHLPGDIGYIKLNEFSDPDICAPTVVAAMGLMQNVSALIIDLRDNGGGSALMEVLIESYLFASPTRMNDLWDRKSNTTRQYWTQVYVPGKRIVSQPLFVLTSSHTFSAAEAFTYDLQAQKRATIVGETTGGGAHTIINRRLDHRFTVVVPFQRAINPITNGNWEGTGVIPDVKVSSAEALQTTEKLASERLATANK